MYKFFVMIHIKNENFDCSNKKDPSMSNLYHINYKCMKETLYECIEEIYNKFNKIIIKNNIDNATIEENLIVTKINTEICPKYESLFLGQ